MNARTNSAACGRSQRGQGAEGPRGRDAGRRAQGTGRRVRRAALLLEVIVALAIMIFAMGMLGAQLVGGLKIIEGVDQQTRALQLADRMLALLELDPEIIAQIGEEQSADGAFGNDYPGWFWRIYLEVTDVEGLGMIAVEILHQSDPERRESIDDARLIKALHLLKAAPEPIDLREDFGVSEEQIAQLTENLPFPELDPTALSPQALAQLITPETLMDILPALLPLIQQMAGGQLPQDVSPDMLQQLFGEGAAPFLPAGGGAGGGGFGNPGGQGANPLRAMIESALGDQVSPEELDAMFSDIDAQQGGGAGGGARGDGGARNGGGARGDEVGGPRTIRDLNNERNERNGRAGGRRGGRGG